MKLSDWIVNKFGITSLLHFAFSGWFVQFGLQFGLLYGLIFTAVIIILGVMKEAFLDASFDWNDIIGDVCGPIVAFGLYGLALII